MKMILSWSAMAVLLLAGQSGLANNRSVSAGAVLQIPRPPNLRNLALEDMRRDLPGQPYRFAVPYNVDATTLNQGQWEAQANGLQIWRLKIVADGSVSLNLAFTQFFLPSSAQLMIYTGDGRTRLRPFTAADNDRHGQLWTPPIEGSDLILELRVAARDRQAVRLRLGAVNYGYRDFARQQLEGRSGSCNMDVVCNKEPMWNDPIRSVGAITLNGRDTCSGALINNTAGDGRMLFLTAHHCGIGERSAPSVVVIWNYQHSSCRPPESAQSGGNGDGIRDQFNSGAIFRASHAASDFALIELDDPANPAHKVFWAGWDRSGGESPHVTGIHHPAVAEKRISFSQMPSTTTSYLRNEVPGDGTHVRVSRWTTGTTEPGSSGSPLFDANRRIIGQLHGGGASCQRKHESDWYGRVSISWEGGGTPATRLKDWLDPRNTGTAFMDGLGGTERRGR